MKKLLVALTIFVMVSVLVSALQITELRTAQPYERLRLFTIALDKTTYKIGETVKMTDVQPIYFQCNEGLEVVVKLKKDSSEIERKTIPIGVAGFMDGYISVNQPTSSLGAGSFSFETLWKCGNVYADRNGDAQPLTPNSFSNKKSFTIVTETTTPPKQECPLSECPMGYKQIDWNSKDCKCQLAFQDGDGKCDIGEPKGTVDCTQPNNTTTASILSNKIILLLAGAVFIFGGYFVFIKK